MSKIKTISIQELRTAQSDPELSEHHDVLAALSDIFDGIYREIVNRKKVEQSITVEFTMEKNGPKIAITRYASEEVYMSSGSFYWYQRQEIGGINWTTTFHYSRLGWTLGYNIPIGELYVGLVNKIHGLDVICSDFDGTKVKITP